MDDWGNVRKGAECVLLGGAKGPTDEAKGLILCGIHHFEETLLASVFSEPND